jgi:hypothetical protein
MQDVATSSARGDEHWSWFTVDEMPRAGSFFSFSRVAVTQTGEVKVAYQGVDESSGTLKQVLELGTLSSGANQFTTQVASQAAPGGFPSIDVDSNGKAHIAWDNGGAIRYFSEASGESTVASLPPGSLGRPQLSLDSKDLPHIVWNQQNGSSNNIMYIKKETPTSTSFTTPLAVANPAHYDPAAAGAFGIPSISTNKKAKNNVWADKVHVAFPAFAQSGINVHYKKTTPHPTVMLVLSGVTDKLLNDKLNTMPNLKKLMNTNPTINAKVATRFPDTTMASQATMFTGLKIKNHKIPGDNFGTGTTTYSFLPTQGTGVNQVNTLLSNAGVKTIYDALGNVKKSKAVIIDMYSKGTTATPPDKKVDLNVDFKPGRNINILFKSQEQRQ